MLLNSSSSLSFKLTSLLRPSFFKRFFPGHTKKVLELANKLKIPTIPSANSSHSIIPIKTIKQHNIIIETIRKNYYFQKTPAFPIINVDIQGIAILKNTVLLNKFNKEPDESTLSPLSGLRTISKQDPEFSLLVMDNVLGRELRYIYKVIFAKVIFNLFKPEYTKSQECLTKGLENVFGYSTYFAANNNQVQDLITNKIITLIQHIIVALWGHHKIDYNNLKISADDIFCDSFSCSKIDALTFIELYGLKQLKKLLINLGMTDLQYTLVNHQNLPLTFNTSFSKERTDQANCDYIISKNTVLDQYYDYKSFPSLNMLRCRYSFIHKKPDRFLYLINDLMTTFQKFLKMNNINKNHLYHKLYDEMKIICKKEKIPYIKYNKITNKLLLTLFDPQYKQLKFSICLDISDDPIFDTFFKEKLKNHMDNKVNDTKFIELFPPDCRFENNNNKRILKELLYDVFPKEIAQEYEERIEKLIWKTFI